MNFDLSFKMNPIFPGQHRIFEEIKGGHKRFFGLVGGVGSGKTEPFSRFFWYLVLEARAGTANWIVSPIYKTARVAERRWIDKCPNPDIIQHHFKQDNLYQLITGATGSKRKATVEIKTGENPEGLVGEPCNCIWIDEVKGIGPEAFRNIVARLREGGTLLISATPTTYFHWFYKDFIRMANEMPDLYTIVKAKTRDNRTLSRTDVEILERMYRGKFSRQYLDAEFANYEGLVYDCFDFPNNVFDVLPNTEKAEWGEGVDFGWEARTAVVLRAKIGDTYYYVAEIYEKKMSLESLAQAVQSMEIRHGAHQITRTEDNADPQKRGEFVKLMREWDNKLKNRNVPASRDKGSIDRGIRRVYNLIADKKLKVYKQLTNTLEEYGSYQHAKTKEGEGKDKVQDIHNDIMDATRYDIETSEKRIEIENRHLVYREPTRTVYI